MDAYRPRMSHPLLDRKVHKVSSPTVERPAWDDSQHNLSVYSLTVEEQIRRKLSVISHNNIAASQELRRKLGNEIIVLEGTDGKVALGVIEDPKLSSPSTVFSPSSTVIHSPFLHHGGSTTPPPPFPSPVGNLSSSPVVSDPSSLSVLHQSTVTNNNNVSYSSMGYGSSTGQHRTSPSFGSSSYIASSSSSSPPLHNVSMVSPVSSSSSSHYQPSPRNSSTSNIAHQQQHQPSNQPWNVQRKFEDKLTALRAKVNSTRSQNSLSRLQDQDRSTSPVSPRVLDNNDTATLSNSNHHNQGDDEEDNRPLSIHDLQTTIIPELTTTKDTNEVGQRANHTASKALFQSPVKSTIKSYRYNVSSSTVASSSIVSPETKIPHENNHRSTVSLSTPGQLYTSPNNRHRAQRVSSLSPINKENDYPYLTPVQSSRPLNRTSPLMDRSDSGNQSPINNTSPIQPVTCHQNSTSNNHSTHSPDVHNPTTLSRSHASSLGNAQRFTPVELQEHVHYQQSSSSSSSTPNHHYHHQYHPYHHSSSLPNSNQSVLSSHSFASSTRKLSSRYPPLRTPVGTASVVSYTSKDSYSYPHQRTRSPDNGSIVSYRSERRSLSPSQATSSSSPSIRIIAVPESLKGIVRSLSKSLDPEGDAATAMARARPVDHEDENDDNTYISIPSFVRKAPLSTTTIRKNVTKSAFQSPLVQRHQRDTSIPTTNAGSTVGQKLSFSTPSSSSSLPVVVEEKNEPKDTVLHNEETKETSDNLPDTVNDNDDLSMTNLQKEMRVRATMEAHRRLQLEGYSIPSNIPIPNTSTKNITITASTNVIDNEGTKSYEIDENQSIASDDTDLLLAGPDAYIQHKQHHYRSNNNEEENLSYRSSLRSSTTSLLAAEIIVDRAVTGEGKTNDNTNGSRTSEDKEDDTVAHILAKYERRLAALDTHTNAEPEWIDETTVKQLSFADDNEEKKESTMEPKQGITVQPMTETITESEPKKHVQRKLSFTNDIVSPSSRVRFSLPLDDTTLNRRVPTGTATETNMGNIEPEELSLPSFSARIMLPDEYPSILTANSLWNSTNILSSTTNSKFIPSPIPSNPLVFDGKDFRVSQEFRTSLTTPTTTKGTGTEDHPFIRNSTSEESPTLLAASFTYRHMEGTPKGTMNTNTLTGEEEEPTSIYAYVPRSKEMDQSTVNTAKVPPATSAWLPETLTVPVPPNASVSSKIRWVSRSPRSKQGTMMINGTTSNNNGSDHNDYHHGTRSSYANTSDATNSTPLPPSVFSSLAHVFTSPTMNMGSTPLTPTVPVVATRNTAFGNGSNNGYLPMSAIQPPLWRNNAELIRTNNTGTTNNTMVNTPGYVSKKSEEFSPGTANFLQLSHEPYPVPSQSMQPAVGGTVYPNSYYGGLFSSNIYSNGSSSLSTTDIRSLSIHQLWIPSSEPRTEQDEVRNEEYTTIARNLTDTFQEVANPTENTVSTGRGTNNPTYTTKRMTNQDNNEEGTTEEPTPLPRTTFHRLPSPLSFSQPRERRNIKVERTPPPPSSSSSNTTTTTTFTSSSPSGQVSVSSARQSRGWFNSPLK